MKYILIIAALAASGAIGYTVYEKQTIVENTDSNVSIVETQQTQQVQQRANENENEDEDSGENDDDNGSKPIVTPTPVVTKPTATKTFTMTEVALHANTTSCYSAINGSVYDLTTWIPKHPGGERAIKGICGKDGSDGFNGKHGGKPQQESTLATFKIGVLVK